MGAESSTLNDDFSAQTAAGDNIFAKPLGARTLWRTDKGGLVCASFIFDPKQKWDDDHSMASVTSDFMGELRDGLTKHLVDEKYIAPKTKTLEETVWESMVQMIPKEALAKNLFSDKAVFDQYTKMIKENVTKTYIEEEKFYDALITQAFSYSFQIAIDAYPTQLSGSRDKAGKEAKLGVLTFHLEGIPDGKVPESKVPESDPNDSDDSKKKKKKRKYDEDHGASSKENDADELLTRLGVKEIHQGATVDFTKKFPVTATLFFEGLNRWFSSVVSRRAAKIDKEKNRNPLYH